MVQCIHFMETEVTESTKHGQRGEGGRMCLVMRVLQRCVGDVTNLPFDTGGVVCLPNSGELVASQDQWKCTEQQSQISHALFTVVRALVLVVGDDAIDEALAQKTCGSPQRRDVMVEVATDYTSQFEFGVKEFSSKDQHVKKSSTSCPPKHSTIGGRCWLLSLTTGYEFRRHSSAQKGKDESGGNELQQ
ncbi:hypothetical protein F2Q70_00001203 [Brassica cretica]|uniref:Uncharacterized protein n=1 Tax=Brassica cretica TaxID=69181 RepID=A0A8S9IVC3_BRACR|nr:hypothetical protein F2Q70_00001203 [Brassica cretica]